MEVWILVNEMKDGDGQVTVGVQAYATLNSAQAAMQVAIADMAAYEEVPQNTLVFDGAQHYYKQGWIETNFGSADWEFCGNTIETYLVNLWTGREYTYRIIE